MDVRVVESLVMLQIGDGVLTALFPVEHCARWEFGPWAPLMGWFKKRPNLTRALGVAQVAGMVAVSASLSKVPGPAWKK
ncbi:hypothetical protein MOD31_18545 [Paenarthrobacter sp. TYUT067]|uniref:hypothetical protein n=1 Tax=Paenarthrobacter sp. TYUT067 TaxID=2926245 RepID=UPI002030985E|nr:hypothetical protein [Paenarthrobacter sp. TYUT067]MCM0618027.1 hypothetical protein [Paenarthrobacter sp. TYUT067]